MAMGLETDGGEVGDERFAAVGEEMAVEEDEAGVEDEGKDGVEDADHEEADDFGGGQHAAEAGEGAVGRGCCWGDLR